MPFTNTLIATCKVETEALGISLPTNTIGEIHNGSIRQYQRELH